MNGTFQDDSEEAADLSALCDAPHINDGKVYATKVNETGVSVPQFFVRAHTTQDHEMYRTFQPPGILLSVTDVTRGVVAR